MWDPKIGKNTILARLMCGFLLLGLIAIPLPSWSQDEQSSANSQQFEQWLKKNGFGNTDKSIPPPPIETAANVPGSASLPASETPPPTLEDSQQTILNSVPPSSSPLNPDSQKAFNSLLQQNMPLSPEQVVKLRQQVDISQRAAAAPAVVPPKPVSTTLMINLAPGSSPPAIRLAQGYVSSLVFVDSTGAPWPVAGYEIGNPKATNLQWDGKSNILMLQAASPYSDGNLVVRLVNLPTPITLELISGQRVVDFRVDIHVAGVGPNAKEIPSGVSLPGTTNQLLLNILDGVAPPDGKVLSVKGGDCQGWLLGDRMYLRTRFIILSPGWIGKMTSPDGMTAYEMPKSSSVLISRYGEPVELKVEGF